MAWTTVATSPDFAIFRTACENDDTNIFNEAISTVKTEELNAYYDQIRYYAIRHNATSILDQLVQRGVSMKHLRPLHVVGQGHTSIETLELLLANGWDINARYLDGGLGSAQPFMWHVVENHDMVVWCLEHGATFDLVDRRKRGEPILERVAASGDIQTFDLLRSKGAPLGERTLHRAVEAATFGKPDPANAEKDTEYQRKERISHIKCMDMVRHLIHEVHLDVNAPDQPEGSNFPDCKGPPICYIASYSGIERDTRELTWLLLDQGADPNAGLEEARLMEYPKLAEDIKAWKAKQSRWGRCCVQ